MGLPDGEEIMTFWYIIGVWRTDRRTDALRSLLPALA